MSILDERVIGLKFDNKEFESKTRDTIKTLKDLNEGLRLDGAAKGFSEVDAAQKGLKFDKLSNAVENISSKFSALGIIGVTALMNITNSAINAGKQMVKALALDPIKMGFQEYEIKMDAIQTILTNTASKGTTLKDVTATLDELNTYADKTVYNFAEMTKNLSLFTTAGVSLEDSALAIKGMANLAAGSGVKNAEAQRAMYQLSQAMSAGVVKLIDWRSMENAGLGGELFKNALLDQAEAMGIYVDRSVPFRETLEENWLTSDVMLETLRKFSNDESLIKAATQVKTLTQLWGTMQESVQSGWSRTWEYIIGNKDEAAAVLTEINNAFDSIVGKSAEERNAAFKIWNEQGGRTAIIDGMRSALSELWKVMSTVQDAFKEIFPRATGEQMIQYSQRFKEFAQSIKFSGDTLDKIKRSFKGIFAAVDIIAEVLRQVGVAAIDVIKYFAPMSSGLLDTTASLGDFLLRTRDAIKSGDILGRTLRSAGAYLKPFGDILKLIASSVGDLVSSLAEADLTNFGILAGNAEKRLHPLRAVMEALSKASMGLGSSIKKHLPLFYEFGRAVGSITNAISDKIVNVLSNTDYNALLDTINTGLFAGFFFLFDDFFKNFKSFDDIAKSAKGVLGSVKGLFDGVRESMEAYQKNLQSKTLLTIASAIGILTASIIALSLVDSNKLTQSLAAIGVMMGELSGSLYVLDKTLGTSSFKKVPQIVATMIPLSSAILILAVALEKISGLNLEQTVRGLTAVGVLMAELSLSMAFLNQQTTGRIIKGSAGLVIFAGAIVILTRAVERLGELNVQELIKGLVGVGAVMAEIAVFMKVTSGTKLGVLNAAGIFVMAGALNVLASAVSKFSQLNAEQLTRGLTAVGVILAEIGLFQVATAGAATSILGAAGMVVIVASLKMLVGVLTELGNLPIDHIGRGLLAMGGSLAIIAAGLYLIPPHALLIGASLLVVAQALRTVGEVMATLKDFSWSDIARSLVALAGSLAVIAGALYLMTGALPGAAALFTVSHALGVFIPRMIELSSLSWGEVAKGLIALAAALAVMGGASYLLAPLIPAMLGVASVMALLGIAVAGVGAGILAFATGLSILAVSGVAAAGAIAASVAAIVGIIPTIAQALGNTILVLVRTISEGAPLLVEAAIKLMNSLVTVIMETAPSMAEAIFTLVVALLTTIDKHLPDIIEKGLSIVTSLLKGVAGSAGELVGAAIDLIAAFLRGVASRNIEVIDAGFDLVVSFINGMADSMRANTPELVAAMKNLFEAVVESSLAYLELCIPDFIDGGKSLVELGLGKGINDETKTVVDKFGYIVGKSIRRLLESAHEFVQAGKDLISGFISGILSKVEDVGDAIGGLARGAIDKAKEALDINSPSKKMIPVGGAVSEGMAVGIKRFSWVVDREIGNLADSATSSMSDAIAKAADIITNESPEPTIRPVIDLTDVEGALSDLGRTVEPLNLEASVKRISEISPGGKNRKQSEVTTEPIQRNVTLTQNNYSPKALNRIDIYRQTKNLFSQAKDMVDKI